MQRRRLAAIAALTTIVVISPIAAWRISLTPEYLARTGDQRTKLGVMYSLPQKAHWRSAMILRRLMRDADPEIRRAAVASTSITGCTELAPGIRELAIADNNVLVRAQAVEVLAEIAPEAARPLVQKGFDAPEPDLRIGSLLAARHDSQIPEDTVLKLLRDTDSRVRDTALDVACEKRMMSAVPYLADELEKQDVFELTQIHDALRRITGVNLGTSGRAWMEWYARKNQSSRQQDEQTGRPSSGTTHRESQ